jgi:DNA repair protein RadD
MAGQGDPLRGKVLRIGLVLSHRRSRLCRAGNGAFAQCLRIRLMELRPYQHEAVQAVYRYLREHDGAPLIVLPTAAGKSIVLARIASDAVTTWNGRVLILSHVKELLEQNADKIRRLCPRAPVGLYSAGLRQRETDTPIVVAGIQSVYKRAYELGVFDLVLIDEAHLLGEADDSMYRRFLRELPGRARLCGLTATPYRLTSGLIYGPDRMFSDVCYEVGIKELISQGYLSPLQSKAGRCKVDTRELHVRGGEFVADEVERLMDGDGLVESACAEIVEFAKDRQACLIFAAGVQHGQHVARVLQDRHGLECGFITGATPAAERDEVLARFRSATDNSLFPRPPLRFVVNVQVMTVGVDVPRIDTIAILRPTMSPGLLVQMVGRGFRLHPGKSACLILDFGGNIERHGPIDQIKAPDPKSPGTGEAPAKECPQCRSVIAAGYATCPDCGYVFPPPERQRHEAKASEAGILSGQVTDVEYEVRDVTYRVHAKRDAPPDAPRSMRVDYRLGLNHWQSEWICVEHTGYARHKAEQWWRQRSPDPVPDTAERAVEIAEGGGLCWTEKITVRSIAGEKYDRIINYVLGPKPEPCEAYAAWGGEEEIPF